MLSEQEIERQELRQQEDRLLQAAKYETHGFHRLIGQVPAVPVRDIMQLSDVRSVTSSRIYVDWAAKRAVRHT